MICIHTSCVVDPNVEVLESDSLAAVLWRISGMSQCPTGPSNMYILLSLQVFIFDLTVSLIVLPFNMVLWVLDCGKLLIIVAAPIETTYNNYVLFSNSSCLLSFQWDTDNY